MLKPIALAVAFATGICAVDARAAQDDRRRSKDPIDDLVAVSVTSDGHAVVLATPALPTMSLRAAFGLPIRATDWRFRLLRVRKESWPNGVRNAWLSTSGTKMLVRFRNGTYNVLDLTKPILQFGPPQPGEAPQQTVVPLTTATNLNTSTHTLTEERYLVDNARTVLTLNDRGAPALDRPWPLDGRSESCASRFLRATSVGRRRVGADSDKDIVNLSAVVIASDGVVCRVTNLGTPQAAVTATTATLPSALLDDAALLVSNDAARIRIVMKATDGRRYRIIDPDTSAATDSRMFATRNAAILHAAADVGESRTAYEPDSALDRLADMLDRRAPEEIRRAGFASPSIEPWIFYRPQLVASLYSPVLEFAESEDVFPSSFGIWSGIDDEVAGDARYSAGSKRKREAALFDAYRRRYGDHKPVEMHVTSLSYAGSWLIEFWLYYPFDRGPGHHLHDSEHVFVEVDKLGGFVRQVIGAAHGVVASNNIYRTTTIPDVPAALLPLYIFVEKGKHASAPDIDKDGVFSLGTDVNVFRDRAKVWGVRDDTAVTDINLRSYDSSMTLRRDPLGMHVPKNLEGYFTQGCGAENGPFCDVTLTDIDLTSQPTCHDNQPDSEACATRDIVDNEDARRVFKILKPSYAPTHFIRAGYTRSSTADGDSSRGLNGFQVGGAVELSKVLPSVAAFPGRVSGEALFRWRPRDLPRAGLQWGGVSIHYERLTTNLYGFFVGFDALRDYSAQTSNMVRRGWLTLGPMFEYAPYPHLNISVQGGAAYSNKFGMQPTFRVSLAYVTTQHANFGGRRTDLIP